MIERTVRQKWMKRLLSLLLAVSILTNAQGFTACADTVSRNEVQDSFSETSDAEYPADDTAQEDGSVQGTVQTDLDLSAEKENEGIFDNTVLQQEEDTVAGSDVSENSICAETENSAQAPANPVHHCTGRDDGTDTTTWSYIYFGSYPQSDVTDTATIAAIDDAIAAGNGTTGADGTGTDVWVDGTKYRRISKADTNNNRYFDEKPTNNGYRYFKWERIKWRVLSNDDNGTLFVVADSALDCNAYNDVKTNITWESCTIRNWLNGSFFNTAFSNGEQNAIAAQNVVNENNPNSNAKGGNDTIDKVYLLSMWEVTDVAYGFCNDYSTESVSRRLPVSSYANARGVSRSIGSAYEGNCWWWLRSPGYYGSSAACVVSGGYAGGYGNDVDSDGYGVAPALHIHLSSGIWSVVDDGTSGDGGEDLDTKKDDEKEDDKKEDDEKEDNIKVTRLSIIAPSKRLAAGKKVKLSVKGTPSNASKSVTWKTSKKKYATIDKNGKLKLKKAGAGKTVKVTATAKDGSGKKATIKIKIMKHAVKRIKLSASSKSVKAGKSIKIKAKVTTTGKNANKTLKWKSSNPKYATVNKKGKVKTKKAGKGKTVTITASSTDGSNKKAKIKIKIK